MVVRYPLLVESSEGCRRFSGHSIDGVPRWQIKTAAISAVLKFLLVFGSCHRQWALFFVTGLGCFSGTFGQTLFFVDSPLSQGRPVSECLAATDRLAFLYPGLWFLRLQLCLVLVGSGFFEYLLVYVISRCVFL